MMSASSYTELFKSSFPPVVNADTRVIVLGSLPGEASLAAGQYYAHVRNHFWRLMGDVLETELVALAYPERLQTLLRHGVGLWDVVAQARRRGSLDSQLRDVSINDFSLLLRQAPGLRAIGCNGGESWRRASAHAGFAEAGVTLLALPSSSPAYTLPYADKLAAWLSLREWL